MRVVIQRVSEASVHINNKESRGVKHGLLIFVGIDETDVQEDIEWLSQKIIQLRIFSDAESKMNLSLKEVNGDMLFISQFTLHASTKKGNRPSYIKAARCQNILAVMHRF